MSNSLATQAMGQLESVLLDGNLAKLSSEDRVMYYKAVCESVGLNPLTKPFEYITLNGKLTLYARRDATDQLRQLHKVSIKIIAREVVEDCYVVTAQADNGIRQDESIGAVSIAGLKGDARANAMMKCETKAKRRVTLSVCGLGMLDETEVSSIPGAMPNTPAFGAEDRVSAARLPLLDEVEANVREWLDKGSVADAVVVLEDNDFDADEQVALWKRFDSKQRSAMKKEMAAQRAAREALPAPATPPTADVINAAQHRRLEARIGEVGIDREKVKKYCKKTWGVEHLNLLDQGQYDVIDVMLDDHAAKHPKAPAEQTAMQGIVVMEDSKL